MCLQGCTVHSGTALRQAAMRFSVVFKRFVQLHPSILRLNAEFRWLRLLRIPNAIFQAAACIVLD